MPALFLIPHRLLILLFLVVGSSAVPAVAAPAPWYWWVSKVDGQKFCSQTSPGQGWERGDGPFTQAGCQPARRSLQRRF